MAESELSLEYDDIQIEVGRSIGYPADPGDWDADQVAEVDRHIQAGYRQFLYPPTIEGIESGYEWSFLKPTTTITTIARYTTGDIAVVAGICTLTGGTWPTWAKTHGSLWLDGTEYSITTRDSGVQLTVVGDDVTVDEDDWYLARSENQDLPDDFGRIIGDLHFRASEYSVSVPVISESQIRSLLQQSIEPSRPQYAATRFKADVGTGHRQEILWWPVPDDEYELTYRYEAFTGKIASGEYPVGGMKHSEVICESCMAIAEQRSDDDKSLHWDAFTRLLATAIAQDRKNGARYFGPMSKGEDSGDNLARRRASGSYYPITYDGVTW